MRLFEIPLPSVAFPSAPNIMICHFWVSDDERMAKGITEGSFIEKR
jgi:hypothetical protein